MQSSTVTNDIVFRVINSSSENRARTRQAIEHYPKEPIDDIPDSDDASYKPEETLEK